MADTRQESRITIESLMYQYQIGNYGCFLGMAPNVLDTLEKEKGPLAPRIEILDLSVEMFYQRYKQRGDFGDLIGLVCALQKRIELYTDRDRELPEALNNLGVLLCSKFGRSEDLSDIDEAISVQRRAINLTDPESHQTMHGRLSNLALSVFRRFEVRGDGELEDIDEAITLQRQAIECASKVGFNFSPYLSLLGSALHRRFERSNDTADINAAVMAHQQAIESATHSDYQRATCLSNAGASLCCRFEHLGAVDDLRRAISALSDSVQLTRADDPELPSRLSNHGAALLRRFERFGNRVDIDDAIAAHSRAVELQRYDNASKADRFSNLGNALNYRFERYGDLKDCNDSVLAHRRAVQLTPKNHPAIPLHLSNLGQSLDSRVEYLGHLADIDEAISAHRQAISSTPDTHTELHKRLSSLALSLSLRFDFISDIDDLNEALDTLRTATNLIPEGHPNMPMQLNNLGNTFQKRFERSRNPDDLDKAISFSRSAVESIPDNNRTSKALYLSNSAAAISSRFELRKVVEDLHSAIDSYRSAILLMEDDNDTNKPRCLSSLGVLLCLRSTVSESSADSDLDEAVAVHEKAVDLTPKDHASYPGRLINLGFALSSRFTHSRDSADIERAMDAYKDAATGQSSAPDTIRIRAALQWARLCADHRSAAATMVAFSTVFRHIPRLVWMGVGYEDRYAKLSVVGETVNEAVAFAITEGDMDKAVEWLEEGRCVVWGQLLQLRTPLNELRRLDRSLADELDEVSRLLDHASSSRVRGDRTTRAMTLEEEGQRHRRLAETYEELIGRARAYPELEEFLRPKRISDLRLAAAAGSVVVINIHVTRCDALVLKTPSTSVVHVPLGRLSFSNATKMRDTFMSAFRGAPDSEELQTRASIMHYPRSIEGTLASIWTRVARPVLEELGYLSLKLPSHLPRVIWCASGPLAFLPIHAAGIYPRSNTYSNIKVEHIFDFVVSSYTHNLTALLNFPSADSELVSPHLLAVSQPNTPGERQLPGTHDEITKIQKHILNAGGTVEWLDDTKATKMDVLDHMKTHSWIHLACHGTQHKTQPTKSAFLLYGENLTLLDIMQHTLGQKDLAVLSACQTARGVSRLPEEAAHLASGMIIAGSRTVVATMWSVRDKDPPVVFERFYELLGGDSRRSALALHDAVKHLRDEVGEGSFDRWVPFIHLGI